MKRIFTYAIFAAALMMATGCDIEEDLEALREEESSGSGDVRESLIAYYTFDDETGRDMTDNERDGNFANNPSFITDTPNGKGKALKILASNEQKFIIPYSVLGGRRDDASVCFWIKDFGNGMIFVEKEGSEYGRGFYSTSDVFAYMWNYQKTLFDYQSKSLMASGWHHIAVTYLCSENTTTLYVDGSKADETEGAYWSNSSGGKVIFGDTYSYIAPLTSFKIDNIRFYNRVLESDEVRRIYDYEK